MAKIGRLIFDVYLCVFLAREIHFCLGGMFIVRFTQSYLFLKKLAFLLFLSRYINTGGIPNRQNVVQQFLLGIIINLFQNFKR